MKSTPEKIAYNTSPMGREVQRRYRQSPRGKAVTARYQQTEKYKERQALWEATPEAKAARRAKAHLDRLTDPRRGMLDRARRRAKLAGVPFAITRADLVIPERCPVLGIELVRCSLQQPADNSPSLDRIDPAKGYVPGNIQVISQKANRMKSNATTDELRLFAAWVERTYAP